MTYTCGVVYKLSLDWTGGLDYKSFLFSLISRVAFGDMATSLHRLYINKQTSDKANLEATAIGDTDAAWNESYWLLDYTCTLITLTD